MVHKWPHSHSVLTLMVFLQKVFVITLHLFRCYEITIPLKENYTVTKMEMKLLSP